MADGRPASSRLKGFARIRAEYDELFGIERPKVVEIVSWAASLGDRSENADYIYGKQAPARDRPAARAISRKIMKAAKVVDPAAQPTRDQVRFGATVELADEDDNRRTLTHRRRRRNRRRCGPDRLERAARPRADRRAGRRRAHRPAARRREKLRGDRRSATRTRRRDGARRAAAARPASPSTRRRRWLPARQAPPAARRRRRSSATATSACRYWRAARSSAR